MNKKKFLLIPAIAMIGVLIIFFVHASVQTKNTTQSNVASAQNIEAVEPNEQILRDLEEKVNRDIHMHGATATDGRTADIFSKEILRTILELHSKLDSVNNRLKKLEEKQ